MHIGMIFCVKKIQIQLEKAIVGYQQALENNNARLIELYYEEICNIYPPLDFVNQKLNTELDTDKNYIKLADTDSMYIELKDVIDTKYGLDLSKEERNQKILELAQEIQDAANSNLDNISKNLFNIKPGTHYFQLKQEVICTGLLTTGKRRYAMYVTNKEGVPVEELDMKGLELMKSNMNKLFKKFGENLIKDILFGKSKEEIDNRAVHSN